MAPRQCEDSVRTRFLPWPNHVNWGFPVTSVGNSHTTTRPERGALPLRIFAEEGVSFLRPPHVRDFVKEGYLFVPRYEVWGQ